jgi:hypothetical protein
MAAANNIALPPTAKDLTGRKFGHWTVLQFAGSDKKRNSLWLCRHSNGKEQIRRGDVMIWQSGISKTQSLLHIHDPQNRTRIQQYLQNSSTLSLTECWEWSKYRDKDGYGRAQILGQKFGAHVLSYLIFRGDIPANLLVCHTCDNPPCCNPDHLFLGTSQDNSTDMRLKGRHARGEKQGRAILTQQQVEDIRRLYATERLTHRELAVMFGVAPSTIGMIFCHKNWR